jgi:hypothetical protein
MNDLLNINVNAWIENLEKKGRNSFSLLQLEKELHNYISVYEKNGTLLPGIHHRADNKKSVH